MPLNQYELATRLSFMIWATGPDDTLLDAASRGELATKAQVAAKTRAMLGDPKARVAVTQFYNEWMGTSRLGITTKNTTPFPSFTAALQDAMAKELPAFVEHVLCPFGPEGMVVGSNPGEAVPERPERRGRVHATPAGQPLSTVRAPARAVCARARTARSVNAPARLDFCLARLARGVQGPAQALRRRTAAAPGGTGGTGTRELE